MTTTLQPPLSSLPDYGIRPPSEQKKTNIIIIGSYRTGKTRCAIETSPTPVLAHSFDPTGFDTVRHLHDGKNYILDTQFESDNPHEPTTFRKWDTVYHQMKKDGVFENIGTFVLDSLTTWCDAAMNVVLDRAGRAGQAPVSTDWKKNDWSDQKTIVFNSIQDMLSLPCNVIMTAHPTTYQDRVTGATKSAPMLTGNLKDKVPLLFSYILYAVTEQDSSGLHYKLLTQPDGMLQAGCRLPKGRKLDKYEEPNITNILRKVGVIE